jgi:hypothetical protein
LVKDPVPAAPPKPRSPRSWLLVLATPLLCAAVLLAVVAVLGRLARDALRGEERYTISFGDIDCVPPGDLSREEFLEEVQYIAQLPDAVCVLDDSLPLRLKSAFARHPWVEEVQRVEVAPPRQVRVRLVYRQPVLTVTWSEGESLRVRSVDRRGILLPLAATDPKAPALGGEAKPPLGQTGQRWDNDQVEQAAAIAGYLHPYQDRLHLQEVGVTKAVGTLGLPSGRALWGRVPGFEEAGEAAAEVKLQRLLDFAERPAGDPVEIDLRPADGATVRRLK